MANYGIVESTKCSGRLFSLQHTENIENGAIVAKGDLITGTKDVYAVEVPEIADRVYLVDNPAWSYESEYATYQNEESFINKAGVAFRARELRYEDKYKVYSYQITPITDTDLAVGQLIVVDGTTTKMKAVDSGTDVSAYGFVGEIEDIETVGFPYCVGSIGTATTIGSTNFGYTLDTTVTKVKIRVIKNA